MLMLTESLVRVFDGRGKSGATDHQKKTKKIGGNHLVELIFGKEMPYILCLLKLF